MMLRLTTIFTVLCLLGLACAYDFQEGDMMCGCAECSSNALNSMAGEYSCGDRILYLMDKKSLAEADACVRVGGIEFTDECGVCNPTSCDGRAAKVPQLYCGCEECTPEIWNRKINDHTCGARISYVTDVLRKSKAEACSLVAGTQFPEECGLCDPRKCSKAAASSDRQDLLQVDVAGSNDMNDIIERNGQRCGCDDCTDDAWYADADGSTCGARIEWLAGQYDSQEDACLQVAGVEFPDACGRCNPLKCDGQDDGNSDMTLWARTPLYCFPDFKERTRFRNVWGKYTVEVKEDAGTCGPSDNRFTTNTVALADERKIKLQFKKVGEFWEASEVRVRLPEALMPFHYGTFSFSIGGIQVVDTNNGEVLDTVLPQSLILGLFTWDDTESFARKENMNHEVDIEISRWDIPDNQDLQFLVQPPGNPQKARFFSGPGNTYKQAHRTFEFDWRPAEIEWFGDHGENHVYSAEHALNDSAPDFTQCLSADVEVRMNLWNLYGTSTPTGMEDHHMVEVMITDFDFTPSGLTNVPEGGVCTKDCQCGNSSTCVANICQSSSRNLQAVTSDNEEDMPSSHLLRESLSQEDRSAASVVRSTAIKSTFLATIAALLVRQISNF